MKTEPITIRDIIALGARRHPRRPALRDRSGSNRTYAELHERTTRLANALLGLGLVKGDRVAAWMGDGFEYVEVYLAAAKAGLVVCPINARSSAPEAGYQLLDSGARVLIWTHELEEKVSAIDTGLWASMMGISVGVSEISRAHEFEGIIEAASLTQCGVTVEPGDLYIIGYTSGTTGRPKGAMLTHRSVMAIARQNAFSFRMSAAAEVVLTGSMSFVSVVPAHIMVTLRLGGTVTIMGRWEPEELLDVIEKNRATFTYIPSPLLSDVTAAMQANRLSWQSLNSVLHSASRASIEHLSELHSVVGTRLVEGWGMTEHSGGLATATAATDYLGVSGGDQIFSSVGRPVIDVDVRLVDTAGEELAHDGTEIGELLVASPALMSGYWNLPAATEEALQGGWYHTGDLGSIDSDGYVRISERRTDLIVSGGANVYPSEVERCIGELAAVREVAVVGTPHPRWGQSVVAVVVAWPGAILTEADVLEQCRREMAGYKKPSRVLFVAELPRTAGQKVARARLRDDVLELLAVSR